MSLATKEHLEDRFRHASEIYQDKRHISHPLEKPPNPDFSPQYLKRDFMLNEILLWDLFLNDRPVTGIGKSHRERQFQPSLALSGETEDAMFSGRQSSTRS